VAEVRELDSPSGATIGSPLESVPVESTKPEPAITVPEEVVSSEPALSRSRWISLVVVVGCLALALGSGANFLFQRWSHSSQTAPPPRKLWQLTFEPGLETDPS